MTALPQQRMTVDEYLVWAEGQPGRYELFRGEVIAMTPERSRHAEMKFAIQTALANAIRRGHLPCHMLPDGMTVRIDDSTAFEPDTQVYCGARLAPHALEVPNPVIVVEVLSPSTRHIDLNYKFAGYFHLPSVHHLLIVDPDKPLVVHHACEPDGTIRTQIMMEGSVNLDPPGIELTLNEIYGGTDSGT